MTKKTLHIGLSALLAVLLFAISASGNTLPKLNFKAASDTEETTVQTKVDLQGVLTSTPKVVVTDFVWQPQNLPTFSALPTTDVLLPKAENYWRTQNLPTETLFPSVRLLIHYLICSPNAP
ncbi:MAG: hypothetical protein AAF740_01505 [Bacteroidota bacterium]